jgi:hypothetical protein
MSMKNSSDPIAPRPRYLRECHGIQCTGGWVSPRAGLDVCGNFRPSKQTKQPFYRPSVTIRTARCDTKSCTFCQTQCNFCSVHLLQQTAISPHRIHCLVRTKSTNCAKCAHSLRKNPEERNSLLLRGGSLASRIAHCVLCEVRTES